MFSSRFKIIVFLLVFTVGKAKTFAFFKNTKQAIVAENNLLHQEETVEKVQNILEISKWYYNHYNDSKIAAQKSLSFAYQAYTLSKKIDDSKGNADSALKLAIILQQAKAYAKAKVFAKEAVNGYTKLKLYNELGESWVMYWSANCLTGAEYRDRIPFLEKAADAFSKSGNNERMADCYKEIGDLYQLLGESSSAINSLKISLGLYNKLKHDRRFYDKIYGVYDLLGISYLHMGDHKTAIEYGLIAARIGEKIDNISLYLCTIYNRLGMAYFEFQDNTNAKKYYLKSIGLAEWHHNMDAIREVTYNYTNVLLKQNKTSSALQFLNSMKAKHPDFLQSPSTLLESQYMEIYMRTNQFNKAAAFVQPLKEKIKVVKDYSDIMIAFHKMVMLSIKVKDYEKAIDYSHSYDSMAKKLNTNKYYAFSSFLKYSIDSAQGISASAMNNYREYVKFSKNLYNERKARQINQMTILYETEKKNKNIIQLKNNSIIQKNKLRHAKALNNLMIISTLSLLIIAALLFRVYRLKKRTNKILSEQQEEINKKNLTLQNLLVEKEWLLKEIHHRVKNNLHMVVGLLASQSEFLKNEEAVQAINNSQNRIQTMSLLHQKLYQSESLSLISMPSYIFELTEYLKDSFGISKSIRFVLDIDNFDLPLSHSIPIGLIFNEAITNSIKYAFPNNAEGKIEISLKADDNEQITLVIHDNGIGLPPDFDPNNNPSLGIQLMKGLSEDIKGEFEITNDNGTKVSLVFLVNETMYD